MAVTYATAVKTARMTAVRDDVCGGTSGTLEVGTAGMATVLATFTLTTSGGTVSTDTWTLAFSSSTVAATNNGTAAAAQIKDNIGTPLITALTVGTGSEDIVLDNASLASGQNITLSTATIQHA